jgi:hypothetical protein
MQPKRNKNGDVLTRYVIRDIKNKEWDDRYSQSPAYKMVQDLKSPAGTSYGKRIIFQVALTEEWIDEYKKENNGSYNCVVCLDIGATPDRKFCKCDLGRSASKAFSD